MRRMAGKRWQGQGKGEKGEIDGLQRAAVFFKSHYSEHSKFYQEIPISL
jgi:hypothetical protein